MYQSIGRKKTPEMNFSRIRTQANTCMTVLAQTLDAVLGKSTPADKFVSSYFRNDKRLGSRDRRLISQVVFSVFRQFGFLRAAFHEHRSIRASGHTLALYMLGASVLEGFTHDVCRCWLEHVSISENDFDALSEIEEPLERFKAFASLAGAEYVPEITDSVPEWALPELAAPFDRRFYEILQTRPPMWIRAQTKDISGLTASLAKQGLHAVPHTRIANALSIADAHVNLYTIEAFRKGLFELQDISSQCIGLACMPSPGEIWWDACSGGGGKALQLASLMERKGVVTATDIREYKLLDLKKRAARAAFPNIRTAEWNGKEPDRGKRDLYNGVLVDAPCSSSGRWRRNPDARWIAQPEWLEELPATQKEILDHASKAVRHGGVLVYATCSMLRRENADVVNAFLETHPEFRLEPFPNPLTGELNHGMQQIMPWDADCDASFAARFRRI